MDGIIVQFKIDVKYLYTNTSAGILNIKKMKNLAIKGEGLNSYIIAYVRTKYAAKLSKILRLLF